MKAQSMAISLLSRATVTKNLVARLLLRCYGNSPRFRLRDVNISAREELPFLSLTAYYTSKGAMEMIMRSLAVEVGPLGLTVNNVSLAAIETPLNKDMLNGPQKLNAVLKVFLGGLGKPEEIAILVALLTFLATNYITGCTTSMMAWGGTTRSSRIMLNEATLWKRQKNRRCWPVSFIGLLSPVWLKSVSDRVA
ncbi:hypothetical protein AVDCRST_MAG81-19 [uncultured Synechococcales cyanobacterium]|uniref:Uncharacterized protein n=1 Tax=uncultured Synechococcales cyanobacterium TaxID=1936017 RepID=A0A6J4UPW3_9CYAN|nr:hypothetical protein AVDCRST_MAG81-19 [uncultured Synechococcales cyanobacterium]